MATPERHLLAVFPTADSARAAAETLTRQGVPSGAVRVGARDDEVRALRAEQREEMSHTWVGAGNVGPFTKEMSKGLLLGSLVGGILGALVGIVAALIFMDQFEVGLRILVGGAIGALGGATLGFTMGGGLGAKGPAEQLAGEQGVTVLVRSADPTVRATLERCNPLRLDVLDAEDHPVGTVTSAGGDTMSEVAGGIARTITDEAEGDWSPVAESDRRRS
jgi:hypothetical protein